MPLEHFTPVHERVKKGPSEHAGRGQVRESHLPFAKETKNLPTEKGCTMRWSEK
jgi:hypothetical protein